MALTPETRLRLWDAVPPKTVRMNATPNNTRRAGDLRQRQSSVTCVVGEEWLRSKPTDCLSVNSLDPIRRETNGLKPGIPGDRARNFRREVLVL